MADPNLGPLQDNGGLTFTYALLSGSAAINAGDNALTGAPYSLTTDQRGAGFPRQIDGTVDIGAFEFTSNTPPTFTLAAAISRQQGSPAGAALTVGTVADGQTAAGSLIVPQIAGGTATGITVASITNTDGTVMVQVSAACGATSGTVRFQVSDGSLTGTGDLQVDVTLATLAAITTQPTNQTVCTGSSATFSVEASGALGYQWRKNGTPINGATASSYTIAATTTPSASGAYNFTVTASAGSCSGARSYTLTVACPALAINPAASLPAGQVGMSYTQTLTVTPSGSYTFSLIQGSLPGGLMLNATTGVISGTPLATGTYNFTVKAQAASGCSGTMAYTLQITCPPVTLDPTSLPSGTQGAAYSQQISASPAGGNYSFAVTSGTLPGGLSLNPSTGVLSGTPTANGSFNFTLTATGYGTCTGSRAYTLTVGNGSCPTLTLPTSLPNGQPGQLYSQSVAASPAGNYSYKVTAGALPAGVSLYESAGLLFGYPTTNGTYNFTLKAQEASGCFATQSYTVQIGAAAAAARATAGDFDGDGKSDLGVWRGLQSEWLVLQSKNSQLSTALWGAQAAPYHDVLAPGDYDGDKRADWAVYRRGSGVFYVKCSSNGAVLAQPLGSGAELPVTGDYDGDGKTDFAVWQGATGNWLIRRSTDGTTQTVAWGLAAAPYNDVPVAGDYDGDGKTDVAVFRRANGTWYVQRSSDGAVTVRQWGLGTDVPVVGDYDGDGQSDLAVWRGATGYWYVLRSSHNSVQTAAWGASWAGDVAVPGDYDGDGKCDLAVWREPEGRWYVLHSADNALRVQSHGQAGDQPITARQ